MSEVSHNNHQESLSKDQLLKLRQSAKCSLTKRIKAVEENFHKKEWEKANSLVQFPEDSLARIEALNERIWAVMNEKESDNDIDKAMEYRDNAEMKLSDIKFIIKNKLKEQDNNPSNVTISNSRRENQGSHSDKGQDGLDQPLSSNKSLPSLHLPRFEGELLDWPRFWQAFESTIDADTQMPTINKHRYLRDCITGRAARVIDGIPLTSEGYPQAIKCLERTYGKRMAIMEHMVQKLWSVSSRHHNVFDLTTEIISLIRTFRSMNIKDEQHEITTVAAIKTQMNPKIREKWNEYFFDNDDIKLEQVELFMERERTHLSDYDNPKKMLSSKDKSPINRYDDKLQLAVDVARPKQKCSLCDSLEHRSWNCQMEISEKRKIVKERKLCFNCLSSSHLLFQCKSNFRCRHCKKRHHSTLCSIVENNLPRIESEAPPQKVDTKNYNIETKVGCRQIVHPNAVQYDIGNGNSLMVLLDTGGEISFIKDSSLSKINHHFVENQSLNITGFGGKSTKRRRAPIYQTEIQSLIDDRKLDIQLTSVPYLGTLKNSYVLNSIEQMRSYILPRREIEQREIDLIIGMDYYWKVVDINSIKRIPSSELVTMETIFGPVISGPSTQIIKEEINRNLRNQNNFIINRCLQQCFAETEYIEESSREAKESLEANLKIGNDQRIIATLPFINHERPPNNVNSAKRIIQNMFKRQRNNEEYINNEFKKMLDMGLLEKAKDVRYILPYFVVEKENKRRIVYDASCGYRPLNKYLYNGDVSYPHIDLILIRSRLNAYIRLADVTKAFLQLEVEQNDRKYLGIAIPNLNEWKFYQFVRIPFGINCGPALFTDSLKLIINRTLSGKESESILQNIYMDDVLFSGQTKWEREHKFETITKILNNHHFHWGRSRCSEDLIDSTILGIKWTANDRYGVKEIKSMDVKSKRDLLKMAGSVFDPMGIFTPWLTKIRTLIRHCWEKRMSWDAILPTDIDKSWRECYNEWESIKDITINRFIDISLDKSVIHCFVDASIAAIAVTIYLTDDNSGCFIFGKSKLASNSTSYTTQRGELNGILFGSEIVIRLIDNCQQLNGRKVVIWSDSKDNLIRIRNAKTYDKVYERNRIEKIRKYKKFLYRFCPGTYNKADYPSRINKINKEKMNEWLTCPNWLMNERDWPEDIADIEMKQWTNSLNSHYFLNNSPKNEIMTTLIEKYRNWSKLCGTLKQISNSVERFRRTDKRWSIYDIGNKLILHEQDRYYHQEILELKNNQSIKNSSPLYRENVAIKEGMLTIRTRCFGETHKSIPVIPNKSKLLQQIIIWIHEINFHSGMNQTIFLFRRKYFSFQLRRKVRACVSQCAHCRLRKARSIKQMEGLIPDDRLKLNKPFEVVGIDFGGPFTTTDIPKVYTLLITCSTTRAVHIECTTSLDAVSTVSALRRFIARRGTPRKIISDNAASFSKANEILSQSILGNIQGSLKWTEFVKWENIPPRSPWWGGFYERLIGILKRNFNYRNERTCQSFDLFRTTMTEIETVMNTRPLTAVEISPHEISTICPLDLLRPHRHANNGNEKDMFLVAKKKLEKNQFRYYQKIQKHLRETYLDELRYFHKSRFIPKEVELFKGDIVLVGDDNDCRKWILGIVHNTFEGKDNIVRTVDVKTIVNGKPQIKRRAIQRLSLLEKAECRESTNK